LIGLVRGVIADKTVNKAEVVFLLTWIKNNIDYCDDPIVNQLYLEIKEMLTGNMLDEYEQKKILNILANFSGESIVDSCQQISSSLPICSPAPLVKFEGRIFCLTGKFAYGPRNICQDVIVERGGITIKNVTQSLDYLVVGTCCSNDWLHKSYGRKIMMASEQIKKGGKTSIISEDHWAAAAFRD
jgi:NAD-dependent DNA ligase